LVFWAVVKQGSYGDVFIRIVGHGDRSNCEEMRNVRGGTAAGAFSFLLPMQRGCNMKR
jgi:hypothetical protein